LKLSHNSAHKIRAYDRVMASKFNYSKLGLFGMSINQAGIGQRALLSLVPKITTTGLSMNETVLLFA